MANRMVHYFFDDIITFFVSIFIAAILLPQILRVAFRKNLLDKEDSRKIHHGGVPRLGGLAFFPAILFSFCLIAAFNTKYFGEEFSVVFQGENADFYFGLCAVLLMYMVGILDDLIGLSYPIKFGMQILASILLIFSGVYVDNFFGFLWVHPLATWFSWFITVVMVTYIVNSINLIDGIDGLASGLSIVAFVFYAIIFFYAGQIAYSMLASAAAGTLMPFYYFNVFGKISERKKIFMGDTGALTIGLLLAFCGLKMLHLGDVPVAVDYNPVILGVAPLLLPMFDVVRVFINRLVKHQNPFLPDQTHIHHRLLALGLNQRWAMGCIIVWSMFIIVIDLFLSTFLNPTFIIMIDVAIWMSVVFVITRVINHRAAITDNGYQEKTIAR